MTKGSGAANFALSRGGWLVYVKGDATDGALRNLVWVDREGAGSPALEEAVQQPRYPAVSRSRRFLAASIGPAGGASIWILDLEARRPGLVVVQNWRAGLATERY